MARRRFSPVFLLLAGMVLLRLSAWPSDPDRSINQQVLAEGEALRYGLETGAPMSQTMPGSSLLTLLRHADAPPGIKRHLPRLLAAVVLIMVFGLGTTLHSPACGLLAALTLSVLGGGWFSDNEENVCMALTVLAAAHFAVRRARAPDARGGVLLGLAVGASLMIRSTLWPYPFVLSAYELVFRRGRTLKTRLQLLLPVWAAVILVLLPWIGMNYGIHGRFIPFEDSRYDESVVSGALGLVSVVDGGDVFKMAGITREDDVLLWAAGEVLRHPLRYTVSCMQRAWHAALLHPLI
ncbi:MAG: glycosyltransferase family 39 protein, partial [Elusimicrobiota bacterium]